VLCPSNFSTSRSIKTKKIQETKNKIPRAFPKLFWRQKMLRINKPAPWMTIIPLALVSAGLGFALLQNRSGLPETYRYKFTQSLERREQTRTQAFAREIAFLQERVNRNPNDGLDLAALAGAYIAKARVSGQNAWYVLAEQSAERSLNALPLAIGNTGAQLALAEIAQAQHDFSRALVLIEAVLRTQPRNASALALRASIRLAQGDPMAALQDLEPLVKALPNASNLNLRAVIFETQGKLEAAQKDFVRALELEDADDVFASARTRTLFARFSARHGQTELARGLLEEALRIAPGYPLALLQLADLEFRQGRMDRAQALFNQLLNASQGSPSTFDHAAILGLARIAQASHSSPSNSSEADQRWNEAVEVLRKEVTGGAFGHRRELARVLLERGRSADINEALKQAKLELQLRQDWESLNVLAWAQQRAGLLRAARASIRKALAVGVQDAELEFRAGQIEQSLGNLELANKHFAAAEQINPNSSREFARRFGSGPVRSGQGGSQ
jgi:tetratricopeptide (TPR) repeat protein